jgi:hypothetical protein
MTLSVAFAGRGVLGMWIVLVSSSVHLCLSLWFVYMALAYRLLPDPSWFPNTVGIGICAVKTWLYYPVAGKLLMTVRYWSKYALLLSFLIFFLTEQRFRYLLMYFSTQSVFSELGLTKRSLRRLDGC